MEYSITPLGRTLEVPFATLCAWSMHHASEVERAQEAYALRSDESVSAG